MTDWFKRATLGALALMALGTIPALSQTVPSQNPTYIPAALIPVATIPTGVASAFPYQVNGQGQIIVDIGGSPVGLVATFQGTTVRTGTPVWTNLSANLMGTSYLTNITAAGKYRLTVAGYAQVRLNVTALTSGVTTVAFSGGPGVQNVVTLPNVRATYSAASLIGTGATTHFLVLSGSATRTVRVTHVECSGLASAAVNLTITAEIDSAADTVDAGTALTNTPNDSADVAATAVVVKHTTSPTPGALIGLVRAGGVILGTGATIAPVGVSWDFGVRPSEKEIVLHGVAQQFALNTNAAFGSGASVGCDIIWTED